MSRFNKARLLLAFVVTGIVVFVSLILFPNWQGAGFLGILALFALAFVGVTTWLANSRKAYFDDNPASAPTAPTESSKTATGAALTGEIHSFGVVSPKYNKTIDWPKVIQTLLDLWKSGGTGMIQLPRLATLPTEVQLTPETLLIKWERRYTEPKVSAKARETQEPSLPQESDHLPTRLDLAYRERIREANSVSLSILVWGPSESDSDLYRKRVQIRNTLRLMGHDARFSEDWQMPPQELGTLTLKQQELIQAQLADLIIILYASFGSIAETHDMGNLNDLKMKLLVLVDQQHTGSYGAQGLLRNLRRYDRVYPYTTDELRTCSLMRRILEEVDYCRCEKWENMQRAQPSRITSS